MEEPNFKTPEFLNKHLSPGTKPIMVCVGSFGDFGKIERTILEESFSEQLPQNRNVNYQEDSTKMSERNFLGERKTFTMSTVDRLNKFSEKFLDCTGLVVTGKEKTTEENISFLTHQDPTQFLYDKKDYFVSSLMQRLMEIKDKCEPGTIDAVIVGGKYTTGKKGKDDQYEFRHEMFRRDYLESIELISQEIKKVFGFNPIVVNGPKTGQSYGYDNIYYDTENRRLYLIRPEVNPKTGDFTYPNIDSEKRNWKSKLD